MNVHMYENAVTQRNLNTCRELGWTIVEPESGMLACGDAGKGRMEEPARIETAVKALLLANRPDGELPLKGLAVLVTAGPTQEPLDPVRYLHRQDGVCLGRTGTRSGRTGDACVRSGGVGRPVWCGCGQCHDRAGYVRRGDEPVRGHGHHRHGRGRRRFPSGRAGPGQDQEERAQRHRTRAHLESGHSGLGRRT